MHLASYRESAARIPNMLHAAENPLLCIAYGLRASVQGLEMLLRLPLAWKLGASWSGTAVLQLWQHPNDLLACMQDTCRRDIHSSGSLMKHTAVF